MTAPRTALGLMAPDGWALSHNPGNGDNTNYGAHCVPAWVSPAAAAPRYDVMRPSSSSDSQEELLVSGPRNIYDCLSLC